MSNNKQRSTYRDRLKCNSSIELNKLKWVQDFKKPTSLTGWRRCRIQHVGIDLMISRCSIYSNILKSCIWMYSMIWMPPLLVINLSMEIVKRETRKSSNWRSRVRSIIREEVTRPTTTRENPRRERPAGLNQWGGWRPPIAITCAHGVHEQKQNPCPTTQPRTSQSRKVRASVVAPNGVTQTISN